MKLSEALKKATPGPWKFLDGAILSEKINSYGNFVVAAGLERNDADKANAELIRRAPMLEEAAELLNRVKKRLGIEGISRNISTIQYIDKFLQRLEGE